MSVAAIIWAGFVATTLTAAYFWVFRSTGWTIFSPSVALGGILRRDPESPATETLGLVILFLLGSTVVPLLYGWVLSGWLGLNWRAGAMMGAIHGMVALALLPVLGMISASVRHRALPDPGRFGLSWGRITPLVLVSGHVLYGGVVTAILAGF